MPDPTYNTGPGQQPGGPYGPYGPGNPQPQGSGKATASLVLGIVSIVFSFLVSIIGLICGVIGVILGAGERVRSGSAKAGMICSIIGIVVSAASMILAFVFGGIVLDAIGALAQLY